jgi:diguanylate cyclase (GGDEF)-like protein
MLGRVIRTVFRPIVRDRQGVRRYVAAVTFFAWVIAAVADIPQRIIEGSGLPAFFFQEAITLCVVLVIAIPIAQTMGLAHLGLYHARLEAERARLESERLSRTDSLTGLANRRAFYEAAADLKGGTIALAIADIDRFQRINDQHGHAAGDEALMMVAQIMHEELSDLGLVARLGGEEFGLLSSAVEPSRVHDRLQRFCKRIAEAQVAIRGQTIGVTISAGFAVGRSARLDELYSAADRALYVAKAAGRNRVVSFEEIEAALPGDRLQQAG